MKKSVFVIYGSYLWTRTLLGLTFHPYQSIRETIRRPVLLPVIFLPPYCHNSSFYRSKSRISSYCCLWHKTRSRCPLFINYLDLNSFLAGAHIIFPHQFFCGEKKKIIIFSSLGGLFLCLPIDSLISQFLPGSCLPH